jgi:iron-sulfur cluster assembly protein
MSKELQQVPTEETGGVTLNLTAEAAEQVRRFMEAENLSDETAGLRVSVLPGGCSGFEYALNVEDDPQEDDFVIPSEGVKLFVDPFSAQYLSGVEIGYTSSFQGSGFTFTNPNATGGCGCGSSFAV